MDEVIETYENLIRPQFHFGFSLKPEQAKCIDSVLKGRDTVAVLPTGFGKSVCYYLPPIILDELSPGTKHTALVVSPLRSLMSDQVAYLKDHGVASTSIISMDELNPDDIQGLRDGNFTVVFISPEGTQSAFWKKVFLSDVWQKQVCLLAVDESHCVSQWGEDFRPEYRKLSVLRSFFSKPILALSATMTDAIKDDIDKFLALDNPLTVAVLPNRPNLYLHVEKSNHQFEDTLAWLVDYLKGSPKKVIVFCRSIYITSEVFAFLVEELGESAYVGEKTVDSRIVEMFHSSLDECTKDRILQKFKTGNTIRCLVSTIAFGMGVDIPDIRIVIHWGAPSSFLQYWQQVGRCSRDGEQGVGILYAFPRSLVNTDDGMKAVVASGTCKRETLLYKFILSADKQMCVNLEKNGCTGCESAPCTCQLCNCCSQCHAVCTCIHKFDSIVQRVMCL